VDATTHQRMIAIVATLNTKEPEAAFLADQLAARGCDPHLIDVGITGARAGLPRNHAVAEGGSEAGQRLGELYRERGLAGVIGIGGNQGTAAAAIAMRELPIGVPKILVSTIASGNMRPYIGASDIVMMPAVGDLLGGPNRLTRGVLARAAAMMAAMIEIPAGLETAAAATPGARASGEAPTGAAASARRMPAVALTTLGNVEPAARGVIEGLAAAGVEVIPFHASGAGGTAMELLAEAGLFAGVVDLATHELLGEIAGGDIYAPVRPGRLTAAGRLGLPQVVLPGGLDYFVFGPPDSVPAAYRGRALHQHNPYNTNIRAQADELQAAGELMARRLRDARGPVVFIDPVRGWSQIGRRGGPLWDDGSNEAFRRALRAGLGGSAVRCIEIDAEINDPAVAGEIVTLMRGWLGR
jgi:uncharacterized protein (UPF0261 family)